MVKSYKRFEQDACFGVIASNCNPVWLPSSSGENKQAAGRALVAGLEEILIWDIKTGDLLSRLRDGSPPGSQQASSARPPQEVTRLAYDERNDLIAAGYADGTVKIWDVQAGSVLVAFHGHRAAISQLLFDPSGTRVVSGSRDSDIIIWDLVSEVGLCKLRSHKAEITGVALLPHLGADGEAEWLVSVAKDGNVKLWDLRARQCVETHVAHDGECWSLAVAPDGDRMLTSGGLQGQLKLWTVDVAQPDGKKLIACGAVAKSGSNRTIGMEFDSVAPLLLVQNADRTCEVLRIRQAEEVKKVMARRRKRLREKGEEPKAEAEAGAVAENVAENSENSVSATPADILFAPYSVLRLPAKTRGATWAGIRSGKAHVLAAPGNNSLELHAFPLPAEKRPGTAEPQLLYCLDRLGHRAAPRTLCLSSDDKLAASASPGELKVWSLRTARCLRTFDCGYALCSTFLPGDAIVALGTKTGEIELYDVAGSALLLSQSAHSGAVWSLQMSPDGTQLMTGGSDKTVKLWQIAVSGSGGAKKLSLQLFRTLELTDDVLAVRFSPNGKLLAVALLDSTVKVFFADSLKFFLSLYGHKLPVLAMDISDDSRLLVTCSADKNIKIWGLDFGDCHKSIFGHQDAIMAVRFEPNSHNFFSASKDRLVKYWDGDKFENIQKLAGHHGEVWAVVVAQSGDFVVTVAQDRSLRVWRESEDEIFLEEEREKEMEELYEDTLLASLEGEKDDGEEGEDGEEVAQDAGRVAQQTAETLKAGEKLMEALQLAGDELEKKAKEAKEGNVAQGTQSIHPLLQALGVSPEQHVLDVLKSIRRPQLEDALNVLPFAHVLRLLQFADLWTSKSGAANTAEFHLPLIASVVFFLVKVHEKEIVANNTTRALLGRLQRQLRHQLETVRDRIGFNVAGLQVAQRTWRLHHQKEFIDEYEQMEYEAQSSKKRAFSTVV